MKGNEMQLRRLQLESDGDVLLCEGMTETITLHAPDGTILLCKVLGTEIDDPDKYLGTLPYDWIDPQDRRKVKAAITAAAKGKEAKSRYMLLASLYGDKAWIVETEWLPTGCKDRPVLGVSRTYMALPKLSKTERTLFLELAEEAENRHVRDKSRLSTAERAARSRLARKLKISPRHLVAFAAAYHVIV